MRKLLVITIKYTPIVQLALALLVSVSVFMGYDGVASVCDYTFGNNLLISFILILCSYTFYFCLWHRIIIMTNFVNRSIVFIDASGMINIDEASQLIANALISVAGLLVSYKYLKHYSHVRSKD